MNNKSLLALLFAGIATSLLVGCDGGGEGGTAKTAVITAQTTVNGLLQPWSGANLNGLMIGQEPCDPVADVECVFSFSGVTSVGSGTYTLYTNALPAEWNISATQQPNSNVCSTGASWTGNLDPIQGAQLVCGSFDSSSAVVTPSGCLYELNNATGQVIQNTCTFSTITLSLPSPATMSTAHAMTVGTYNDLGTSVSSNSLNAGSSTSIIIPTPSVLGVSAMVVVDPATNKVIGVGSFTRSQIILNPCGRQKSC